MNRFRQQLLDERRQQRMDARAQAEEAEACVVVPDLSFSAAPCLVLLGQERLPHMLTRLAMLSLVLSLGLAACSPTEASPTALSSAPQVTLESTFTPTFAPTFTPVSPATLEPSPNAPATQEALALYTLEALVQSGINAEKSGEGWILSTTDANAQRVELGEIQKVGDSYKLVFTTTEGNPASENLAMVNYDKTSSSWVISEPEHNWPVYRLTEQGWEQLLFKVNPDAPKFHDPEGNVLSGIQETWNDTERGVIWMRIFGYGQGLQVKEEDVTIVQKGILHTYKGEHPIITVVVPIEGSQWGLPIDLNFVVGFNVDVSGSGDESINLKLYQNNIVYPSGSKEDRQTPYQIFSLDVFKAYLANKAPIVFEQMQVVDLLKWMESIDKAPGGNSVLEVNNFLLTQQVDAKCSSREECVRLLEEKGLTDKYILISWLTTSLTDELRTAIQGQQKIPSSRIVLYGGPQGIGQP